MSFGGGTGGFSFGNPASSAGQSNQSTKPAFSFGGTAPAQTAPPAGGFSFGSGAGQTVGGSSTTPQQGGTQGNAFSFGGNNTNGGASGGLFGGAASGSATPAAKTPFSFGTPAAATTPNAATTTPATAPPTNLFGGFGKPAATSNAAGSGSLFGQPSSSKPVESSTPAPSTFGGFGTGAGAPAAKPAGGFTFGNTSATTPAAPGNTSATNVSSAANATPAATKPTGFNFNASSTPAAAPSTGFSFGAPKPTDNSSKTIASAAPSGAAPPTFSFGAPPATSAAPAGKDASSATTGEGSLFTGFKTDKKDEAVKPSTPAFTGFGAAPTNTSGTTAPTSTQPASSAGLFAPKGATDATSGVNTSTSSNATAPAPVNNLFAGFGKPSATTEAAKTPTTSAPGATGGTSASGPTFGQSGAAASTSTAAKVATPSVSLPPPSMLRGRNMEEIVNKWSVELENATKEFARQAAEVAVWDGVLRRGGDEISRLMQALQAAEERQLSIEQTLDYVEQQQADLSSLLDSYETQVADLLQAATMGGINAYGSSGMTRNMETGAADAERERAYTMAESLNAQLDELSRNLGSMIVEVNNLSSSTAASRAQAEPDTNAIGPLRSGDKLHNSGADPVSQIVAILNAHLGSLKWIDESTNALREKVENLRRGQIGGEGRSSTRGDRVSASPTSHRREGSISNNRNRQSSVGAGGGESIRAGSVGPGYSRGTSVGRNAGQGWSEANIATGGGSNLGRSRGYGL